jgi:ankyrin repeat protein
MTLFNLPEGNGTALQDEEGRNALMMAAEAGHAEAVSELLAAGVPWNAVDRGGRSAGDYAMAEGHTEAVSLLIDAGRCPLPQK